MPETPDLFARELRCAYGPCEPRPVLARDVRGAATVLCPTCGMQTTIELDGPGRRYTTRVGPPPDPAAWDEGDDATA